MLCHNSHRRLNGTQIIAMTLTAGDSARVAKQNVAARGVQGMAVRRVH